MKQPRAKRALFWASQLVLLGVLWFLLTGKIDWQEFSLGVVSAVLAGMALTRAGAHRFAPFDPQARWLAHILSLPYQALRDSITVILAMLASRRNGSPEGHFSTAHFKAGGDDPQSTAKRALAVGLTSFPPNSIIIDIDRHDNTILYHEVVPQGSVPEPAKSLGEE